MPASVHRSRLLSQLRADVSRRWQLGERVRIESYLEQHPNLASDVEAVLDLLGAEVLLRDDSGEPPSVEEYVARFPHFEGPIRQRWAVLRMLVRGGTLAEPTQADGPSPPRRLPVVPGYEILQEIGRGGMGVVYLARQQGLDRLVALKLIRERLGDDERAARFRIEALAIGRLRHPHVVGVFAYEQAGDWLALAMEHLPGGNLAGLLEGGPLAPGRAAELTQQMALGLQAAHDAGVVHRDLKPSNVLLADDGTVRVADFGLARLLDCDDHLTAPDAILGTPAYMAPEQAAGLARDVGPPADVWSLGAILYHCLTGRPPFKGETPYQTLNQVRDSVLTPPRALRPEVPPSLDLICRKCLQKDPGHRYRSSAAVADDLGRFLRNEKIQASLPPARPWLTRRVVVAGVAALVVLVILFAGTSLPGARNPNRRPRRCWNAT